MVTSPNYVNVECDVDGMDKEEVQSLVSSTSSSAAVPAGGGSILHRFNKREYTTKTGRRYLVAPIAFLVTFAVYSLLVPAPRSVLRHVDQMDRQSNSDDGKLPHKKKNMPSSSSSLPVTYSCPKQVEMAQDFDARDYEERAIEITTNMTEYIQTFRNSTFDNWRYTYNKVQMEMSSFKSKYYPLFVRSNSTIYESAMGIGLNLFMTLELLEDYGIEGVTIYGNEYLEASTIKANALFDYIVPGKGHKGILCQADSTKLDEFLPAESFDVVFTGYISPLPDPLSWNLGTVELNDVYYKQLCEATRLDWKGYKLNELAQQKQNDWYGKWIAQMTRIAKPGAAIMIEQVSSPFCEEYGDWGGVRQSWWVEAIETYGWNVDPQLIMFEADTLFHGRYHVFMRKNTS